MKDELRELFPTPVLLREHTNVSELNKALSEIIRADAGSAKNFAETSSNHGGFHSGPAFLKRSDAGVQRLCALIEAAVDAFADHFLRSEIGAAPRRMSLDCWGWSVVMREGDANWPHVHPQATCSGVYYVDVPERAPERSHGGALVLVDPRTEAALLDLPDRRTLSPVHPRPGLMVVFPSYLRHFVPPFRGPGERTCVAFNAHLKVH